MAEATREKLRRQRALVRLVQKQPIANQDGLATALRKQGFRVTQSTLSRDIRELGIVRVPSDDGYRYQTRDDHSEPPPQPERKSLESLATFEVTAVDANEVAVVLRTLVGRAQGVAVYLDNLNLPEVLGTVAGDDTIVVLPASVKRTGALRDRLAQLFGVDASR